MESLFTNLSSRKRCSPNDLRHARAKFARGEKSEVEIVTEWCHLALTAGIKVWLCDLVNFPLLDGERCEVLDFDSSTALFRVKRLCGSQTLKLHSKNLSYVHPDGGIAFVQTRAVLFRLYDADVVGKIVEHLTCLRCSKPCTQGTRCQVEHPAARREVLGHRVSTDGLEHYMVRCDRCQGDDRVEVLVDSVGIRRFRRKARSIVSKASTRFSCLSSAEIKTSGGLQLMKVSGGTKCRRTIVFLPCKRALMTFLPTSKTLVY